VKYVLHIANCAQVLGWNDLIQKNYDRIRNSKILNGSNKKIFCLSFLMIIEILHCELTGMNLWGHGANQRAFFINI